MAHMEEVSLDETEAMDVERRLLIYMHPWARTSFFIIGVLLMLFVIGLIFDSSYFRF